MLLCHVIIGMQSSQVLWSVRTKIVLYHCRFKNSWVMMIYLSRNFHETFKIIFLFLSYKLLIYTLTTIFKRFYSHAKSTVTYDKIGIFRACLDWGKVSKNKIKFAGNLHPLLHPHFKQVINIFNGNVLS